MMGTCIDVNEKPLSMEEFLENPPFPKFLQFETGTTCNAHCRMCPHDKMKRAGTATWGTIGKIIQEAIPKVDACCPFLMQEPLLEPRLIPILSNIRARNPACKTIIYTNMSVLSDEQIHRIVDYDLLDELHISFYGPTAELYDKWQRGLNWKRTLSNIQRFHAYRQQQHKQLPTITHHVLAVPELFVASQQFSELTAKHVDTIALVQYDTFHGDVADYGGDQTRFFGRAPAPRTPCQRLWSGINVHFDGNVVPCCIDYNDEHVMGNIHKNTLQEIWEGPAFQKFRSLHAQGRWSEIPMCRRCVVHEYQFNEEWVKFWLSRELITKS
jgi:radical SAM protein with 4Fe4S-binding SPASM domain